MSNYLQNNIYEKRIALSMTQQALANVASVTRQTIIAIEKGNYTPSVALALSLAQIFACSVEDLFWYN